MRYLPIVLCLLAASADAWQAAMLRPALARGGRNAASIVRAVEEEVTFSFGDAAGVSDETAEALEGEEREPPSPTESQSQSTKASRNVLTASATLTANRQCRSRPISPSSRGSSRRSLCAVRLVLHVALIVDRTPPAARVPRVPRQERVLRRERAVFVCFNVLHQHTHTYLGPDPAVGLEPRADKYGPALTSSRWARVW